MSFEDGAGKPGSIGGSSDTILIEQGTGPRPAEAASHARDGRSENAPPIAAMENRAPQVSRSRYRLLFENNAAAMICSTLDGRIVEANLSAAKTLGFESPQTMLGFSMNDIYLDPQSRGELVARLLAENALAGVEACFRRVDGGQIWVLANLSLIPADDGRESWVVGSFVDITERKRAEKELRLAQFSVEHALDAVFWVDALGRIVYVNAAGCRSLERSREEILSLTVPDIHPHFSKEAWETFGKELKARGSLTFETEHQTRRGRVFPVEMTATYLELGGNGYAFAFARDITERKRAQRYQHLSTEILGILNEPLGLADVVNRILAVIKQETGVDAVGIRLRSGDDFPYFVQSGFSPDFLLTENTLIARDKNGGPCRDRNGSLSLECTCGLVLSGQTDPANPLFTPGGSCWTTTRCPCWVFPPTKTRGFIPETYVSIKVIVPWRLFPSAPITTSLACYSSMTVRKTVSLWR